jgi:GLPGLI family protein
MKVEVSGFKIGIFLFFICFLTELNAQTYISNGKVVFERRTNLEKRFEGMEDNRWMRNVDLSKPQVDQFELIFNDSSSVFRPIIDGNSMGMSEWLTMKNTTYQNLNEEERKQEFSFFGTTVLLKDSLKKRTWRMTESKREIAGYNCRQALWEANDSTRIYAWYAEELIPPIGPETFNGLPGVILGLAIEDGGVVYFAKSVEIKKNQDIEEMAPQGKKKDWYTEQQLKDIINERFGQMGSALDRLATDVFMW